VHAPAWHVSPGAHARPQIPQFAGSVASGASQPSAAVRLQSAKPAAHWNVHASFVHIGIEFGCAGHTAHVGPHAFGSVATVQAPPHLL
jgi:hypothetical protein